jgi:hypothetical protein
MINNLNKLLYGKKCCHYSFKQEEHYSFEECEELISDEEVSYVLLKTGVLFTKSQLIDLVKSDETLFEQFNFECNIQEKSFKKRKINKTNKFIKNGFLNDDILKWIMSTLSLGLIKKTWPTEYTSEDNFSIFIAEIKISFDKNNYSYDKNSLKRV